MGYVVETVEDKIYIPTLAAMDKIVTPKNALVFKSMNVSSGGNAAIVTANLAREEQVRITAFFENLSDRNITFYELKKTDETRGYIPYKVSEYLVP